MKNLLSFAVIFITIQVNLFCATYTVTNTSDSGAGSLRQAIDNANAVGADIIEFNIPNTDSNYDAAHGVWVISPVTYLPYFLTGNTIVDGSLSSQFLTGLLMALPLAEKDSELIVNNLKSRFYIDLTIKVLKDFGIKLINDNYEQFFIQGGQLYRSREYDIEGDWSGAALLLVAGAIGGEVEIENMDINSSQADRRILDVLEQFGARIAPGINTIRVIKAEMKPFNFDATDSPDLFPPLVALASYAKGKSRIKGVSRLAGKESNRAEALVEEFAKVGINIETDGDKMIIHGGAVTGGTINSRNDHRIAMAAAVAGIGASGSLNIQGYECISKSYPDFFTDYQKTGGRINE